MPVTKDPTPSWNFSWRSRPKGWVDDPVTAVDEDGVVYQVTVLADAEGNITTPASGDDLYTATTETNNLLGKMVTLLEELASR